MTGIYIGTSPLKAAYVGTTPVKEIYVGTTKVRPSTYEISYDLKGGNVSDLQAAGFDGILTNGSYVFANDGLQQTSSSNDRYLGVYKNGLDLSNAKKITIRSLGYRYRASWANGKDLMLLKGPLSSSSQDIGPGWGGNIVPNTNSSRYCRQGISYYDSSRVGSEVDIRAITTIQSGDTTMEMIFDLNNKTLSFTHSGANNNSFSTTLSNSQIEVIRGMQSARYSRGRGYHTYDSYERLKEIYLKIEY